MLKSKMMYVIIISDIWYQSNSTLVEISEIIPSDKETMIRKELSFKIGSGSGIKIIRLHEK